MPSSKAGGSKNPSLQDTEKVTMRNIKMKNTIARTQGNRSQLLLTML